MEQTTKRDITNHIKSVNPAKGKLIKLLKETRALTVSEPDAGLSDAEQYKHYEAQERKMEIERERLELLITTLQDANKKWLELLNILSPVERDEEDRRYAVMTEDERGILNLIEEAWDAHVTITRHIKDVQKIMLRLKQPSNNFPQNRMPVEQEDEVKASSQMTVRLPKLELKSFDGDSRHWIQFWTGFNSAVHQQNLPDIQKLNYLLGCLKGAALEAVESYAVIPENYGTVTEVLVDRFGDPAIIKRTLHRELKMIRKNDRDLRSTVQTIERVLTQLTNLGENIEQSNMELSIEERLPMWVLDEIYKEKERSSAWSIHQLRQCLRTIAKRKETIIDVSEAKEVADGKKNDQSRRPKQPQFNQVRGSSALVAIQSQKKHLPPQTNSNTRVRPCAFCKQDHWDDACTQYTTAKERFQRLVRLKACQNCLKVGHSTRNCKVKPKCCFHCSRNHNSALCNIFHRKGQDNTALCSKYDCEDKPHADKNGSQKSQPTTANNSIVKQEDQKGKEILLLCKEIKVVNPNQVEFQERAVVLFDIGSQLSFISKDLAKRLNLPEVEEGTLKIASFGNKIPKSCIANKVNIGIKVDNNEIVSIEAKTTDYFFDFIQMDNIRNLESGFVLLYTKVGPMLAGKGYMNKLHKTDTNEIKQVTATNFCVNTVSVVPELDQFWKLEAIGIHEQLNAPDDEEALKQFKNSISKHNGRYRVCWPWKETRTKLSDNYGLCYGRLSSLVKRLQGNEHLFQKYHETIQDQVRADIIEEVTPEMDDEGIIHYLPHHEVVKTDNNTTKLRIVYDASAHLAGRKSLNDVLYRGPIILPDLVGILLRFRIMNKVIVADVEKAFLQIELYPSDRNCTRFLWLKDISKQVTADNLKCFRFRRVPFGIVSSPFLLSATINYHLETDGSETALEIKKNLYVDNVMLSAQGTEEALQKYRDMKTIFADASMNIREFLSNDKEFNRKLPVHDRAQVSSKRILGINWDYNKDTIPVTLQSWSEKTLTKRTILQFVASQFDPLGFLVPVIVRFKVLLQTLWKKNNSWDEVIDEEDQRIWQSLIQDWPTEILEIPRQAVTITGRTEIHVFTDASITAYAAAVYILSRGDQDTQAALVYAKSRLAPIKGVTIPRLELLGILIGVRAARFVVDQLQLKKVEVTLWSDSRCALHWIRNHSRLLPRFIQNRVEEIRRSEFSFRYIPSDHNPVDIATKGLTPREIKQHATWWNGPAWLKNDKSTWPKWEFNFDENVDYEESRKQDTVAKVTILLSKEFQFIDPDRFSKWRRLHRTTAWALKFINATTKGKLHWLHPMSVGSDLLSVDDYRIAEWLLLRQAQSAGITEEEVTKWNLYYQEDEKLWRVKGRMENAELNKNGKYPIYLPRHHRISELIILEYHENLFHAGIAHTLAEIRSKFWIPKGRTEVKRVINKCMGCRRWIAKPFKLPEMPVLPKSRVTKSRPFERVGLDYLGPVNIKVEKEIRKRWVSLFTCFTTRGVHLEVVEDLSAEAFIHVIRRFTSRRGCPKLVLSDNASQFQLTFRTIMEMKGDFISSKGITWRNITPKAPWKGGIYERLIGLTKTAFRKAVGRKFLRESELITLTTEIEGILNSRPLTYLSFDDYQIIRPIDFLLPYASLQIAIDSNSSEDEYKPIPLNSKDKLIKYWTNTLKALDAFWEIWKNDYLNSLKERTQREITSSKRVTKRVPRLGEVVLVNEPHLPRGAWKIAKIQEYKYSCDGKVRAVTIKMPNGNLLDRPISMLSPLEVDEQVSIQSDSTSQQRVEESTTHEQAEEPIALRTREAEKKRR